jgi:hypothetical protein
VLQAVIELPGLSGATLLGVYVVAGLLAAGAAFLPGTGALFRLLCLIVGTTMAVWAVKVLIFGGVIFTGRFVLLLPLLLLARGVIGAVQHLIRRLAATSGGAGAYQPEPRPHPATRQFGASASFPSRQYAAEPARPRYAAVHFEYPATMPWPAPTPGPDATPRAPGPGPTSGAGSWSSRPVPVEPAPSPGSEATRWSRTAPWSEVAPRVARAPMLPVAVRARHRAPELPA